MFKLENDKLEVTINPFGAELTSVIDKESGFNFIYDADPAYWNRHAPNLFPIVGKLKNDTYTYKGKAYTMTQHGFARDSQFELVGLNESSLIFELTENEETLAKYPFKFSFRVIYTLSNDLLLVSYVVKNPDKEDLLFSVGAHPAFAFAKDHEMGDYNLVFDPEIEDKRYLLLNSIIEPTMVDNKRKMKETSLHMNVFAGDALVYAQPIKSVTMQSKTASHEVTVFMEGIPYLGIWSKYTSGQTPFLCIEPWEGLADFVTHKGDLEKKVGINRLKENQVFTSNYKIRFKK